MLTRLSVQVKKQLQQTEIVEEDVDDPSLVFKYAFTRSYNLCFLFLDLLLYLYLDLSLSTYFLFYLCITLLTFFLANSFAT